MAEYASDKTFDPTPHRRQQARQEGHVAKSHDLCSAGMVLLGLGVLMMLGGKLIAYLAAYCRQQLGGEPWLVADPDFAVHHWLTTVCGLAWYLLPILGLLCLAGLAVNVLQIGFLFLPGKLAFDLARINPLQGLQRMFSLNNAMRLGFGLLKSATVLAVGVVVIYGQREAIVQLVGLPIPELAAQVTQIFFSTVWKIGAALLALALIDYGFQWWKHEQDLKMTPQELREELRNLDGNPQVIARRKQMQRELGTNRSVAAVPQADVIVTDLAGTIAVAVVYDPDSMTAPTVLAKGSGVQGLRIRQAAGQRRIAVVENSALAHAIYRTVNVNRPIPAEHYTAVAEVLTGVYARDAAHDRRPSRVV